MIENLGLEGKVKTMLVTILVDRMIVEK